MPVVLKIDGDLVGELEDGVLEVSTKIRKDALEVIPGTSAFVWSHYSRPGAKDGSLIALGVVTLASRSADRKHIDIRVALSSCPPSRTWSTESLDDLKNRKDGTPETEIADEIRGYTHDHVGHVSDAAAAVMASHFI